MRLFLDQRFGLRLITLCLFLFAGCWQVQAAKMLSCPEALNILNATLSTTSVGADGKEQPPENLYRQMPTIYSSEVEKKARVKKPKLELNIVDYRQGPESLKTVPEKIESIKVGNYSVKHVPYLKITPVGKRTEVFILDRASNKQYRMPGDCLNDPSIVYGGTRWKVYQGETIDYHLTSDLNYSTDDFDGKNGNSGGPPNGGDHCRAANTHEHGLLVSPTEPTDPTGAFGDFVLASTVKDPVSPDCVPKKDNPSASSGSASGMADMPGMNGSHQHIHVDGPIHYSIEIPGQQNDPAEDWLKSGHHPPGLYWYHPHPHGYSRGQLNGGTTGVISIGEICDYAKDSHGKCLLTDKEAKVHQRFMQLKDAQILCPAGSCDTTKDSKDNEWVMPTAYEPGLCADGDVSFSNGECGTDKHKWVFTVNGVQFPVINDVKDNVEVWRILNASPNVSYRLTLQPADEKGHISRDSNGILVRGKAFGILAVDGVASNTAGGATTTNELLMMPGSRAEIVVRFNPNDARNYVLLQNKVETGPGADTWPEIALLKVQLTSGQKIAAGASNPSAQTSDVAFNTIAPSMTDLIKPVVMAASPKSGAEGVYGNSIDFNDKKDVRYVKFVKRTDADGREIFGLVSAIGEGGPTDNPDIFGADGNRIHHSLTDEWTSQISNASGNFPAFGANDLGSIQTKLGRSEVWIIENWTTEIHNFHIHQTKFRYLTREDFPGAKESQYFQFPTKNLSPVDNEIGRIALDSMLMEPGRALNQLHDTVPVPRGEGADCDGTPNKPDCTPGRIALRMDFNRAEQVGTFVVHCHILEHEDLGMMSTIVVSGK